MRCCGNLYSLQSMILDIFPAEVIRKRLIRRSLTKQVEIEKKRKAPWTASNRLVPDIIGEDSSKPPG